jgi:glutathione reductase (NADPH)
MSLRGITFHIEQTPQEVTKSDNNLLSLKTNKGTISGFSHVMFATGRKPNTKVNTVSHFISLVLIISSFHTFFYACILIQHRQNLGLEEVGVKMDEHGAIVACI